MADRLINSLTERTTLNDTDVVEVETASASWKAKLSTLKTFILGVIATKLDLLSKFAVNSNKLYYDNRLIEKVAVGTDKQVQYNDNGTLGGIDGLTFDKSTGFVKEFLTKLYRRVNVNSSAPAYTGTATSGSTTTVINDSTKAFTGITDRAILFTSGANQGQSRAILSFTGTSITVTEAFPFTPAVGDAYEVVSTTKILESELNSVYAFYASHNHAIILPQITVANEGATNFYYVETLATGKTVQFICAAGQKIDGVSNNPNLAAAREGVLQVAHNTTSPHWDTLASIGLTAFATNCSTASFSVTTTQDQFRELQNVILKVGQRFIAPTGQTNRLQYTSIIPRTLPVVCVVNAKSDTANSQIFTLKLRKFTKSTGLTTDVDCAFGEITLNGAQDTTSIMVIGNVSFEIGDQVWAEVKNDNVARNYTVIRSTLHVR